MLGPCRRVAGGSPSSGAIRVFAAPRAARGPPSNIRVLSSNADHLLAVDLQRREKKFHFLWSIILRSQCHIALIQQTGAIYQNSIEEYFQRQGWEVYHSGSPDGTAGVLTIVKSQFSRRYSLYPIVIQPGYQLAVASRNSPSFCVINSYWSSYGTAHRKPQALLLTQWLQNHRHFYPILGGDFNHVPDDCSKWVVRDGV